MAYGSYNAGNPANSGGWPNLDPFLTGYGQRDSHAVTLSNGEQNKSRKAGQPYSSIDWKGILALASAPRSTAKGRAQFIIPSSYLEHDGRDHNVQRTCGQFGLLAVDIDTGSPAIEAVQMAVQCVTDGAAALIYSSSGAALDRLKWRVLIPLACPLPGVDYADTQKALFDLLAGEGIEADKALSRPGQPVFLPNVPPEKRGPDGAPLFYQWCLIEGGFLSLAGSQIESRREAGRKAKATEAAEREAKRQERVIVRADYVRATGDDFNAIEHFNATHDVADLLGRYGYDKGQGDNYRSPLQTSPSYATRCYGDYWVSVSSSDDAAGIGRPTKSGFRSGSAFDLYAFFEHSADLRAAARAYAELARPRPTAPPQPALPIPSLPNVEKARERVRQALRGFWTGIQEAASFDVLQVPTGVGKTRAAIEMTGQAIAEMRARFDFSAACMYAPDHKLNDQILADFAKYAPDVTVTVRRGRSAENPARLGEKMCRNLEAAERAEKFLLDVEKTVCTSCPFKAGCAYLESQSKKADVYILPHASLDKKPPAAVKSFEQGLAFAVIDETPGPTGKARTIAVAAFEGMRATQRGRGNDALSREADLRVWRARLAGVIKDNGEGPLRADLVRLAFDAETMSDAFSAEWDRKIDDADRSEDELEQNRTIPRMAAIWKELASMLKDGRPVTARLMVFNDAEAGLSVRVRSVLKLHDELEKAPRVLLDATANRSLIEMALGPVDQWHDIEAGAPHMRIAQDATVSMSKSMLQTDFDGYGTDLAQSAARNNRQHLIKLARKQARLYPRQTGLVVTYKATAEAIRPHMPEGVTVMHFGATRGRNDAEAVRWVLIAGRPLTKDYAVIEMAETLTGLPVESRSEKMQSQRLYTDGAQQWAAPCEVRGYPDPVAQSCMESIRDAELVQTVGRGRGVNRSAQDPLDILVVGDGFLPFAVHDAGGTWDANKKRDFIEDQLEAGGIAYTGSGAAFAAYGTALSPTETALRKEIERLGDIPLIDTYRGLSPSPLGVFRLKRNKRAPVWTKAYIDTGRHADPRAAVEAQLGPLAMFEVVEAPEHSLKAVKECPASLKAGTEAVFLDTVKSSPPDPEPVLRPGRRLVLIPKAQQIDSPLMAGQLGLDPPEHMPTSFWRVIAGQPFLTWTKQQGRQLAALLDAQPAQPAFA